MSRNETKVYIGLTDHRFKQRYSNHMQSIRHEKYGNSTELFEICLVIEESRQGIQNHLVNKPKSTSLLQHNKAVQPFPNQKLSIINADKPTTLNKTLELVSKCRHENKYYLARFSRDKTQLTPEHLNTI